MHRVINYLMLFIVGFVLCFFIIFGSLMAFKSNIQANTLSDATQASLYKSHDNTERNNRGEYITNFPKFIWNLNRFNIASYNYQDLHFVDESPNELFCPNPVAAANPGAAQKMGFPIHENGDAGKPLKDFGDGAYRVQYLLDDGPDARHDGVARSGKYNNDKGYSTLQGKDGNVQDKYDRYWENGRATNPIATTKDLNNENQPSGKENYSRHYAIRAVRVIAYMKPTGYYGQETKHRNPGSGDTGRSTFGTVKGANMNDDYHVVTYGINTFGKNISKDAHSEYVYPRELKAKINSGVPFNRLSKSDQAIVKGNKNSLPTDTDLTRNHLDNSNLKAQKNSTWSSHDAFGNFVHLIIMKTLGHIPGY